jgi:PKHD-type hydroxylase
MNLEYPYYYFSNALTLKFCDEIIKYGKMQQEQIALIGETNSNKKLTKDELKNLKKKRNSEIVWLNDPWIYKEILPYVHQANKNGEWNFKWDFSESCQFTKYALNQYYNWHCDSWPGGYNKPNDPNFHKKIRKLSVTVCLSDPKDYEGGDLQFNINHPELSKKQNIKNCPDSRYKGSIVIFPSFVYHRVTPVQKGTRYSLVIWNLGYPYE